MPSRLLSLKSLLVGAAVVSLACAIALVTSFGDQGGPAVAEAQQKQVTPIPIPLGGVVPTEATLLQGVGTWIAQPANINLAAATGGRDTHLLDCASGNVNFSETHGWCYATRVKLFFNVSRRVFKDPRTGQILQFDTLSHSLIQASHGDDVEQGLEPPTLPEKHPAKASALVSMQCTTTQVQDIKKHVQNLEKNAKRSDSPVMQALFTKEAQWWNTLC